MTEQEKVQMLKTKLSSEQWTALNMKILYQAWKDPALKQDLEVAEAMGGRAQRRNVICAWVLDPTRGKCYQNVSMVFVYGAGVEADRALAGQECICTWKVDWKRVFRHSLTVAG